MLIRRGLFISVASLWAFAAQADVPPETSFSGNYLASRLASHWLDLDAASDYSAAALKQQPGNWALADQLFQSEVMKGNLDKAESLAPDVTKNFGQDRTAQLVLGLKDFRAKKFADARGHFGQSGSSAFGVLTASLLNAWTYAGEGMLNPALRELDKLDGQQGFANYKALHVALITDMLGNPLRADAAYKKAWSLAPSSLRVAQAYGNFLERQGKKDEAEKVYRDYLKTDPNNIFVNKTLADLPTAAKPQPFISTAQAGAGEVLFSMASALGGEQNAGAAVTYAQLALPQGNDRDFVLTTLGGAQASLKQFDAANDSYAQVSKDSLLRNYADTEIAVNFERMNKTDDAIARLKDVIGRDPKDADALITLGGVYRSADRHQEAIDVYTKALELMPPEQSNVWRVLYDRGISYDHLKQYDKSEADFRKALGLSHEDPQVLNYLGYSMIDRGVNLEEALGMVRKAVTKKPDDGYITDSLGWAYYTLHNYADATSWCEHAVDLIPSDATIADHLGDVYWRVGRETEARFQWQHALDNNPDANDVPRIQGKLKDGLPPEQNVKPADGAAAPKPNNG